MNQSTICPNPRCVVAKRGRCVLPNRYLQFKTLNADSPFPINYQQSKAHLVDNSDARCGLNRIWSYLKDFKVTYTTTDDDADVDRAVQQMRTRGWAILKSRISPASIATILRMADDMQDVYGDLLHESVDTAIVQRASDHYRDVTFREGRVDVTVPHLRRLFRQPAHHAFLRVLHRYLHDLTPEQTALWDDARVFSHIRNDLRYSRQQANALVQQEQKRINYMKANVAGRRARLLFSSVVNALPRNRNDQQWHADPSDLTTEPSGVNVFIALQKIDATNGCTQVVDMTQRQMGIDHPAFYEPNDRRGRQAFVRAATVHDITLLPGQVFMFDSRLLHRGSRNPSQNVRPIVSLSFGIADMLDGGEVGYTEAAKKQGYSEGVELLPDYIMPTSTPTNT